VSKNAFEEAARSKKAIALLVALDRNAAFVGMPPLAGDRGVETVRMLKAPDWKALAREAGVNPPSKATIELIVEAVEARRPMRKTTPRPAQLALVREKAS
jgi:hypothetical protein